MDPDARSPRETLRALRATINSMIDDTNGGGDPSGRLDMLQRRMAAVYASLLAEAPVSIPEPSAPVGDIVTVRTRYDYRVEDLPALLKHRRSVDLEEAVYTALDIQSTTKRTIHAPGLRVLWGAVAVNMAAHTMASSDVEALTAAELMQTDDDGPELRGIIDVWPS